MTKKNQDSLYWSNFSLLGILHLQYFPFLKKGNLNTTNQRGSSLPRNKDDITRGSESLCITTVTKGTRSFRSQEPILGLAVWKNDSFTTSLSSLKIKSTANWRRSSETQVARLELTRPSSTQGLISTSGINWFFGLENVGSALTAVWDSYLGKARLNAGVAIIFVASTHKHIWRGHHPVG